MRIVLCILPIAAIANLFIGIASAISGNWTAFAIAGICMMFCLLMPITLVAFDRLMPTT